MEGGGVEGAGQVEGEVLGCVDPVLDDVFVLSGYGAGWVGDGWL